MVLDSAANFVRETTTESVDSTQTSIGVSDASAFVDPSAAGEAEYNVVIWDAANHPRPDQDSSVEIMRVTAIDTGTNTLTVTRGQEGTSGASHPNGAAVAMMPTAGNLFDATVVSANYTTAGEDVIYVDESGGEVTVTLATVDTFAGNEIEVVNLTGTNTVTVGTEGAETINGGTSITKAGWPHSYTARDGSTWDADPSVSGNTWPDSATGGTAFGNGAEAGTNKSVTVGGGAGGDSNKAVTIGDSSVNSNFESVAIGADVNTGGGGQQTLVGYNASSTWVDCVGVGHKADPDGGQGSVAIGAGTSTSTGNATVIGRDGSVSTADVHRVTRDQMVFGGTRDTIADADLNNGELTVELDETNNAFRLRGKDSGGTVREATVAW